MGRKREADRYNKAAVTLKMKLPKHKRQGRFNDAGLNYHLPPLPGGIHRQGGDAGSGLDLLKVDSKAVFRNVVHPDAKVEPIYQKVKPLYG